MRSILASLRLRKCQPSRRHWAGHRRCPTATGEVVWGSGRMGAPEAVLDTHGTQICLCVDNRGAVEVVERVANRSRMSLVPMWPARGACVGFEEHRPAYGTWVIFR